MGDRPALLSSCRHQRRLATRRCHVQYKLNPQPLDRVDDRVDLRVVLPGLELDDAGLRNAQLLRQGPLAQFVLSAIPQKGCRKLPRWSELLPLRPKARIGQCSSAKRASKVFSEFFIAVS